MNWDPITASALPDIGGEPAFARAFAQARLVPISEYSVRPGLKERPRGRYHLMAN